MRTKKRQLRLTLSITLIVGVAFFLLVSSGHSLGIDAGWLQTTASAIRTQSGECPVPGERCWELCYKGVPSGTFGCYAQAPDPIGGGPNITGIP
jgi:hypothetical protein